MTAPRSHSQILDTPAGPVEYQLEGDTGPLLVGIHGSPGSCFQMSVFLDRLQLTGSRCRRLTISRPGYGRTPLSSGRSLKEQSDLLAVLMARLNLKEPAVVIGFSGGGVSALEFARHHPELTARLVLLSPVTGSYAMFGEGTWERFVNRILYSALTMRLSALMVSCWPNLALRFMLMNLSRLRGSVLTTEIERLDDCPYDREFLLNVLRHTVPFARLRKGIWNDDRNVLGADVNNYRGLTQPILLFHGDRDADVLFSQSEQLHALLPDTTEIVRMRKGGHLLLVEPYLEPMRRRLEQFIGL